MKHTKGPWKVTYDGNWTVTGGDFTICHDNIDDHEKRQEESYANAKLIAAAPELLDACTAILSRIYESMVCEQIDGEDAALLSDAAAKVWQAINKAEGV